MDRTACTEPQCLYKSALYPENKGNYSLKNVEIDTQGDRKHYPQWYLAFSIQFNGLNSLPLQRTFCTKTHDVTSHKDANVIVPNSSTARHQTLQSRRYALLQHKYSYFLFFWGGGGLKPSSFDTRTKGPTDRRLSKTTIPFMVIKYVIFLVTFLWN